MPIAAMLSQHCRIFDQLASNFESWEAIVEAKVRLSDAMVTWPEGEVVGVEVWRSIVMVIGLVAVTTAEGLVTIWNEGRDILSMSQSYSSLFDNVLEVNAILRDRLLKSFVPAHSLCFFHCFYDESVEDCISMGLL